MYKISFSIFIYCMSKALFLFTEIHISRYVYIQKLSCFVTHFNIISGNLHNKKILRNKVKALTKLSHVSATNAIRTRF